MSEQELSMFVYLQIFDKLSLLEKDRKRDKMENNTDSDSDEENSQEENSTISTSQPGRELDKSDILNQQRRRVQQPTTQLNTTPVIGSNNQFTNQPITNNLEQQVTTMDATQFNQLIAALGQLTQQLGNQQGGNTPPRIAEKPKRM
ncbi:22717_t:CDS:2 [Entrophospora sp. SA101]|nr:22717_t:CDS:2 [Entrophospora sp. SA101]